VRAARDFVLVTCEHGGNRVPAEYAHCFRRWRRVLATHRGFDAGALALARAIASALRAPLVASTVSRLVIDLNRSLSNPRVWSDATRNLPPADKAHIVRCYYQPHRQRVIGLVAKAIAARRRVVHLASHSFTPVLGGVRRSADVGLLYDPLRPGERAMATYWKATFAEQAPELRVRRNYPYLGKGDGLTSSLRRLFPWDSYVGLEIEINQALVVGEPAASRRMREIVIATLQSTLRERAR